MIRTVTRRLLGLTMLLAFVIPSQFAQSQEAAPKMTSVGGVDNSTMGIYRALAEASLAAFHKGDLVSAAKIARSIELVWDTSEGDLQKASPKVHEDIDSAMDAYIKPLVGFKKKAPDAQAVQTAFNDYIEKLKTADQPWK